MYSSAILPKENVDFYINLNMVSKRSGRAHNSGEIQTREPLYTRVGQNLPYEKPISLTAKNMIQYTNTYWKKLTNRMFNYVIGGALNSTPSTYLQRAEELNPLTELWCGQ